MAAVRDFFEGLEGRVDESKTAGMSNTYHFDVEGAGQWTVVVRDGKAAVSEGAVE